jgi:methylmalonyl-CoA mutase N-terminal domain/subunit
MKTHVQTAGCTLTEQQPLNNIVRVAYQAMAAVLGGCQSLHTDSMDETLGLPTEQAVTVALRTQQILAHETGVTRTVDPLGGSWFIESLTDTMEREAMNLIDEIDRMGAYQDGQKAPGQRGQGAAQHPAYAPRASFGRSVIAGINRGYFRRSIAEASYRFSEECEAGDRIIVGVNAYTDKDEGRPIDILTISHQVEVEQNDRLSKFKAKRDANAVAAALDAIRKVCRGERAAFAFVAPGPSALRTDAPKVSKGDTAEWNFGLHPTNIMPALVNGALANCTMGEMTQAMADIYGRYSGGPEW